MPAPVLPHAAPYAAAARPELTGGRRVAVLLSHGFTGSPASMRPWAEHLAGLGYAAVVPRLPGHGTSWQDANTTTWQDWYAEVSRAFEDLTADHDAVVVGGLSMGGALALRLAADVGDRAAGVMVVNPSLASNRLDGKLVPLLSRVLSSYKAIGNDIAKPGVDEHAYAKTPLRALRSFMASWPVLTGDLPRVTAPLLYFRSDIDHVVDGATEPLVIGGVGSTDVERVALPDSFHVATLDNDAPLIYARSSEFVARVTAAAG